MKSLTHYYSPLILIAGLLSITSCTTVVEPRRTYHPSAVIKPVPTKPRATVVTKPKPRSVTRTVVQPTKPSIKAPKVKIKTYEPEQGANPYDNVPKRSAVSTKTETSQQDSTSPAVKSLLIQAKGAMLLKRNASAIEKLERALRIEAQNPTIWHQLAKAHYNQKEDATAISMAKKSNLYASEGSSLEKQNWALIKEASKRSEDIKSLKAAIQYERANP